MDQEERLPEEAPRPPRHWLMGNALRIRGQRSSLDRVASLLKEHRGLVRISVRGITYNYTSDADVVQEVVGRPDEFPKSVVGSSRNPRREALKLTIGSGLATAHDDDELWHSAHRIITPALGAAALQRSFSGMLEIVDELLLQTEFEAKTFAAVDLMERLAIEVMAFTSFHTRLCRTPCTSGLSPVDALRCVFADTAKAARRLFPDAFYVLARRQRREADAILAATLDAIVQERRSATASGAVVPDDVLQAMLVNQDKSSGRTLPADNIRHQLLTFLGASLETTASAFSYALYELATRPEIDARVADEVDCVSGSPNVRRLVFDDIQRLNYTERFFKEVLRLHPPGPIVCRHVAHDTVLGGKYRVHQEDKIAIFLPSLHRDPRHWKDPDRFDPDRFLPEATIHRHPHAYHPFGMGMRHCTGFQFATMEAKVLLARLYQRSRPRLGNPTYALREVYTESAKPAGLMLRLEPRCTPRDPRRAP